jgi:acetoacetate decarboxylase
MAGIEEKERMKLAQVRDRPLAMPLTDPAYPNDRTNSTTAMVNGASSGPAAILLFEQPMCDVARRPVREVVGASHYLTGRTLGLGEVVCDDLQDL